MDPLIKSQLLYQLSYRGLAIILRNEGLGAKSARPDFLTRVHLHSLGAN